jgi:hypothetical protein
MGPLLNNISIKCFIKKPDITVSSDIEQVKEHRSTLQTYRRVSIIMMPTESPKKE